MIAAICLTLALSQLHPDPIASFLSNHPIAEARVIEIRQPMGGAGIPATLEIERVYCGEASLVGQHFGEWSDSGVGHTRGSPLSPPLKVGDRGIWRLLVLKDGTLVRHGEPARREITENYEAFVRMADAAAALWNLGTEELRRERLKNDVRNPEKEVATWAVSVLAQTYPESLLQIAHDWSRAGLCNDALMRIDESLSESSVTAAAWNDSVERKSMLAHLVSSAGRGQIVPSSMIDRLGRAIQRHEIDPEAFFKLIEPLIDDAAAEQRFRLQSIVLLRFVVNDPKVGEDVVGRMVPLAARSLDDPLAQAAIEALAPVQRLNAEQLRQVKVLRDAARALAAENPSERNPNVRRARILSEIVDRSSRTVNANG